MNGLNAAQLSYETQQLTLWKDWWFLLLYFRCSPWCWSRARASPRQPKQRRVRLR